MHRSKRVSEGVCVDFDLKIMWNRKTRQLCPSQSNYIDKFWSDSACIRLICFDTAHRNDNPTSGPEGDHMKTISYAPVVSSLMYATVTMRPDIPDVVGIISRFMKNPSRPYWNAVKHIFIYFFGTQDYGITFVLNEPSGLVGYNDSDYASCLDIRKSTSRYLFDSSMV